MPRLVVKPQQLISPQGYGRIGLAAIIAELDLKHIRTEVLDDSTHLAAIKPAITQIIKKRNHG